MTDSEIETLRLAAKAAGHEFSFTNGRPLIRQADGGWMVWNPSDYSGQALELAARLKIDILHSYEPGDPWVMANSMDTVEDVTSETTREKAMRLAITRAAAAMARGEQGEQP